MHTLPGSLTLEAPADGVAYVRGSTDVPLSESTVGQFLRETARRFPDQQAVVFREQLVRWTWSEFDDHVRFQYTCLDSTDDYCANASYFVNILYR